MANGKPGRPRKEKPQDSSEKAKVGRGASDKWTPEHLRDWKGMRIDYETGARTIVDMQEHYGVSRFTIQERAKREKWKRGKNLSLVEREKKRLELERDLENARVSCHETRKQGIESGGKSLDGSHSTSRAQDLELLPGVPPAELEQAAALMQAIGLAPGGIAVGLMSDEERERLAIQLAARRHVEVTRSHKKTLGRLHALIDKTLLRLERYADGDVNALMLGPNETVGSMIRDLSTALNKLVPLERQVHGLDVHTDQVTVFLPFVGKRDVPTIDADFEEVNPTQLARVDIRRTATPGDDDE